MTELIQLDQQIFDWINHGLQNAFLDGIMPFWREKRTWIPLYLALVLFLLVRYRLNGFLYILVVVAVVGLADTMSSKVVKPAVARERPCNEPGFKSTVSLKVDRCGVGKSFTSSHATNHFALASFWVFTLPFLGRWGKLLLWLWAASIAFGQVYVGVHYPFDVLGGTLLGLLIGITFTWLYRIIPPKYRIEA